MPVRASQLPPGLLAGAAAVARRGARRPASPAPPVAPALALELTVPLRVASEANARDGWRARHRRARLARDAWALTLRHYGAFAVQFYPPLAVTLTKLGGRRMDSDNLAAAFKGLRDAIAAWLGIDDGNPLVTWNYAQSPGGAAGVRVRIDGMPAGTGGCGRGD